MTTLDDLIARANNDLAVLEGLIEGDASETLVPDSGVSYPIPTPTYNEANSQWTLTQDTPDTDGLCKGVYGLALSGGCSTLGLVSHNVVTPDDGIPARYMACESGSFTDLTTMTALAGKYLSKCEIRSKNPFSINITLLAKQLLVFDWRSGQTLQLGWTTISSLQFVRTITNDPNVNSVTWTPNGTGIQGSGYNQSHIPVAGHYALTLNGRALTRVRSLWSAGAAGSKGTKIFKVQTNGIQTMLLNSGSVDATWTGSEVDLTAVEIITYAHTNPKQLLVEIDIE